MAKETYKILALHGYTQDAQIFKNKISSWRKKFRNRIEFLFLDGPFEAIPFSDVSTENVAGADADYLGRSWYTKHTDDQARRPALQTQYCGIETTYDLIVKTLRDEGPVHGIMGFSQGATMVAMFLCLLQQRQPQLPHPLQFSIMISGYNPRDNTILSIMKDNKSPLPCLNVYGMTDELVPYTSSQQLLQSTHTSTAYVKHYAHPGRHFVPTCNAAFGVTLQQFINIALDDTGQLRQLEEQREMVQGSGELVGNAQDNIQGSTQGNPQGNAQGSVQGCVEMVGAT